MALEDLIAKFEGFTNPSQDATPPDIDTVLKGVEEVYNLDISVRDHAVKQREETIAELQKQNDTLKQHNYDLSLKHPQSNVHDNGGGKPDADDVDESERAATIRVDSLFTKRKK
jgi:hypothetical protein